IPANCHERLKKNESPQKYVKRIALEKWRSVAKKTKSRHLIVTADTTVALGFQILGKAASRAHAKRMIKKLSGKNHRVLTAVCVGWSLQMRPKQILVNSKVKFRR